MARPKPTQQDIFNNMMARVYMCPVTGCWWWGGCLDKHGYGVAWDGSRVMRAHRLSYMLHRGEIPDGLVLDHLCRHPRCVNPDHLEAVTQTINIRRGSAATKTHCKRGHEFTPGNTYVSPKTGARRCRACAKYHSRAGENKVRRDEWLRAWRKKEYWRKRQLGLHVKNGKWVPYD